MRLIRMMVPVFLISAGSGVSSQSNIDIVVPFLFAPSGAFEKREAQCEGSRFDAVAMAIVRFDEVPVGESFAGRNMLRERGREFFVRLSQFFVEHVTSRSHGGVDVADFAVGNHVS